MPRDQRLYMTFPNDFWMHPKVAPLSTEAKWTFVEMNGYSRMQDLDGVIPVVMADRLWSSGALADLVGSHPERPLVQLVDDAYVIRDYAQHQQTVAERDDLSRKRSEAGTRGRAAQLADKGPASVGQVSGQIWAETETELETEKNPKARAVNGTRIHSDFSITDDMRSWARENVPLVRVDRELPAFVDYWTGVAGAKGVKRDWVATWRNSMRTKQEWAERDAKPTPTAPRDLRPAKHAHKWLPDGTCVLCEAREDRKDTW